MLPYLTDYYGNASSLYSFGIKSKRAIERAREQVAKAINAEPDEIYFTSGATESNNWVLNSFYCDDVIITSPFEHPSIFNACEYLHDHKKVNCACLSSNGNGTVNVEELAHSIKELKFYCNFSLVSVMAVNNELGTIQPIKQMGELCRKNNILFHTDATQAIGHILIDVKKMNIDLMSFSGHKFHAPKGIGVLYIRRGIELSKFMCGGHQENNMRAGTENVASIVGIGKAIEIATQSLYKQELLKDKTKELIRLISDIDGFNLNSDWNNRIAGTINIRFDDCDGESMVLLLDTEGVCISTGSACSTGELQPSRTLKAIGLSDKQAFESIRISLDENITDEEIIEISDAIHRSVKKLRGDKSSK